MKKIIKKILTITLTLVLVFNCFNLINPVVKAANTSKKVTSYYMQLSKREKSCYKILHKQIKKHPTKNSFNLSLKVKKTYKNYKKLKTTGNKFSKNNITALVALTFDHPEYFWLRNYSVVWKAYGIKKYFVVAVKVKFISPTVHNKKRIKKFNNKLNSVVKKLKSKTYGKTKASKAAAINEWIVKNVNYKLGKQKDLYNAYGALVNKKATCDGISSLYKILCNKLGIRCMKIAGYASFNGQGGPHAWNYIKIGKKWYAVDSTWNIGSKNIKEWFLKGSGFTKSHKFISDYMFSMNVKKFKIPKL